VEVVGVEELHAAFLNESRTPGGFQRSVQEIRIAGDQNGGFDNGPQDEKDEHNSRQNEDTFVSARSSAVS
jgi:hypothetical protein